MLRMHIEWKVRVVFTVILSFLTMSNYCLQHKNCTWGKLRCRKIVIAKKDVYGLF